MSFADAVREFQSTPKKNLCKTAVWLIARDEADQDTFQHFLDDGGAAADLHKLAIMWGCGAAETQFRRHCNKTCSCYRGLEIVA